MWQAKTERHCSLATFLLLEVMERQVEMVHDWEINPPSGITKNTDVAFRKLSLA